MKRVIHILSLLSIIVILSSSCKKNTDDFYVYSTPSFAVNQPVDMPDTWYGVCTSHDVMMDSILVTSPLNIRSQHYFQGQEYAFDLTFLIGDTFVPHTGKWSFIFYGRKSINNLSFKVYVEKEI